MDKPITVIISEFKENFANLLNDAQLPAWLLLMLVDPFINQLRQLAELQEKEASDKYYSSLEEKSDERDDDRESVSG